MRNFLMISAAALGLSACASQTPAPAVTAPAAPAASAAPAPQCWNGDAGKFEEGAIMICENWQIARVPLPECNNPLDTLILGALLGRLARS